jgi:hypothetical protein
MLWHQRHLHENSQSQKNLGHQQSTIRSEVEWRERKRWSGAAGVDASDLLLAAARQCCGSSIASR